MSHAALASNERSQFDDFLCAPIGHERNGMALSVLSALARSDIDPWHEAASLAQMSKEAAIRRMTLLIAALADRPPDCFDVEAIAARLIALLPPRRVLSGSARSKTSPRGKMFSNIQLVIFVALMTFLLSTQFFARSLRSPAPAENARPPASSGISEPDSAP